MTQIQNLYRPAAAILIYHRVADIRVDPWGLAVSPQNFAEQMAVLKAWDKTEPLGTIAKRLAHGRGKGCNIAITFDDGYRDNLVNALPILQKENLPATLYTISGALGDPSAFWWDILIKIFLESAELPELLDLSQGDLTALWELGDEAVYSTDAQIRARTWDADTQEPQDLRQKLLLEVWSFLSELPPSKRQEAVSQLADWAGFEGYSDQDSLSSPLSTDELCKLAASPLIEIGGHTVTHCDLSRTTDEIALAEIAQDRNRLREITGQRVDHFGHPYSRHGPNTHEHLAAAGYTTGTVGGFGIATPRHDRYLLPRIHVSNIGGAEFENLIATVTGLPRLGLHQPIAVQA